MNEATDLHTAAQGGIKYLTEQLIEQGADVNAKDNLEETPLDWAARGFHKGIFDLLRKHGAKE